MSIEIPLLFGDSSSIQTLGPEFRSLQNEARDQELIDPIFKTDVNNPLNFKTEFTVFDAKNSTEASPEHEEVDIPQVFAMQELMSQRRPVSVQEQMVYQVEDENLDPSFTRKIQIAMEDEPSRDFVDLVRESNQSARREDNLYGQPPRVKPFAEELKDLKRSLEGQTLESDIFSDAAGFIAKQATAEGKRVARELVKEAIRGLF